MLKKKLKSMAICGLVGTTRPLLRRLASRLVTDSGIQRLRKPDAKMAWQVALPKSGSTWVHKTLSKCLAQRGWKTSRFFPYTEYREQLLDPRSLLLEDCLGQSTFGMQQHCPFSGYTHKIIEQFDIRVILQVRNIFDCLVSLSDHYDKSPKTPMAVLTSKQWGALDPRQRELFLADIVAPWYIRFWVGWAPMMKNADGRVKMVTYERLLADPPGVYTELAQHCDPSVTRETVEDCLQEPIENTRKNKGVVGRGEAMSEVARERVRTLASYYPDIDFSPLGL